MSMSFKATFLIIGAFAMPLSASALDITHSIISVTDTGQGRQALIQVSVDNQENLEYRHVRLNNYELAMDDQDYDLYIGDVPSSHIVERQWTFRTLLNAQNLTRLDRIPFYVSTGLSGNRESFVVYSKLGQ